jgi:hypothetical protein
LARSNSNSFHYICCFVTPFDPNQKLRIQDKRWYLFVGVTFIGFFIRNGGLKITEEMHLNNNPIIFISYLFGLVWFSTSFFFNLYTQNTQKNILKKVYLLD